MIAIDEKDIMAAAKVLSHSAFTFMGRVVCTYGLIRKPQGSPTPAARLIATMLYVKAQITLLRTCFIVPSATMNKVNRDCSFEANMRTLPPADRHLFPCAIMIPTSAAAKLGPSFIPSPIWSEQ